MGSLELVMEMNETWRANLHVFFSLVFLDITSHFAISRAFCGSPGLHGEKPGDSYCGVFRRRAVRRRNTMRIKMIDTTLY